MVYKNFFIYLKILSSQISRHLTAWSFEKLDFAGVLKVMYQI